MKAIRWNNLKRIKKEKNISVRDRIWVTECIIISYHLCFARRLDVIFTSSTWICCAFMLYHWAIETAMIKLYQMNYKVVKLKFTRQSWTQHLNDVYTLKLWKSNFKKKDNCNIIMIRNTWCQVISINVLWHYKVFILRILFRKFHDLMLLKSAVLHNSSLNVVSTLI